MPVVVSNSSPLIHLAKIGLLEVLREQFGQIVVPTAVWHETVEQGGEAPDAAEIASASWVQVREPTAGPLLTALRASLDEGEAEAIALAAERDSERILLDEAEARQVADQLGIPKVGVVGILMQARLRGRISSLAHALDELRTTGFRLSEALCSTALRAVGER